MRRCDGDRSVLLKQRVERGVQAPFTFGVQLEVETVDESADRAAVGERDQLRVLPPHSTHALPHRRMRQGRALAGAPATQQRAAASSGASSAAALPPRQRNAVDHSPESQTCSCVVERKHPTV
jgi:hypothetical protein